MLVRPLSDLHVECYIQSNKLNLIQPDTPVDVTILDGDTFNGYNFELFKNYIGTDLKDFFKSEYVLFIPGNHEFYGKELNDFNFLLKQNIESINGIYLNNNFVDINDVRFIGSIFWTNMKGFEDPRINFAERNEIFKRCIQDFSLIKVTNNQYKNIFSPTYVQTLHEQCRNFIIDASVYKGKKYIATHFAPTNKIASKRFKGSSLNPYFSSDDEDLLNLIQPEYWQFGHTHNIDYKNIVQYKKTKLIFNASGYYSEKNLENSNFNKNFSIEI